MNDVLKGEWKTTEKENSVLIKELEAAQGKVSQLETQRTILSNKLIDAGSKWDKLHEQSIKTEKELETLTKGLVECKAEKTDLARKLKMATVELSTAKGSLQRMNEGTMKLTEILGSQRNDRVKTGIGYEHGASSSKSISMSLFIKGSTKNTPSPIVKTAAPANFIP